MILDWLTLSTSKRANFDWSQYGQLRNSGLTHRRALAELDRRWAASYPQLDRHGHPIPRPITKGDIIDAVFIVIMLPLTAPILGLAWIINRLSQRHGEVA